MPQDLLLKYTNPNMDENGIVRFPSGSDSDLNESPPLVIKFGALGDMIMVTPLLRALAERHGQACDVVSKGNVHQTFKHLPYVASVRIIQSNKTPYVINPTKRHLINWLHLRPPGVVYLLQSDELSHKIMIRAGVTATASDLTVLRLVNEHVIDHMARLAGFVNNQGKVIENYNRSTELIVQDTEKAWIRKYLEELGVAGHPIVVLQPGNRKTMKGRKKILISKYWPAERWAAVIHRILECKPEARIFITGFKKEEELAKDILDIVKDNRACSCVGMNLRESFALLAISHSMISVDTGPAHAAAALDCPLVVLFGQTDPRVNGPVSSHSKVNIVTGPDGANIEDFEEGWRDHHNMEAISIDKVVDAWKALK